MTDEKDKSRYPHGRCECPEPTARCCGGSGPVAHEVTRDGKRLRLCTRCDFSTDTNKKLLVTGTEPVGLYLEFDALGAFVIAMTLSEQQQEEARRFMDLGNKEEKGGG